MEDAETHPALRRLQRDPDVRRAIDIFADGLSGADLTTAQLEVARRRSDGRSPADVLRQYERDRFVRPAPIDAITLHRIELALLESLASEFEPVTLAPVVPLGAHSTVAGVDQNRVVATARSTEVGADPTNALALEAAVRRRELLGTDPRSDGRVRLVGLDRVLRAQTFAGPRSFAHFSLLGLVSAGRDAGSQHFESHEMATQIVVLARAVRTVIDAPIRVDLTDFDGRSSAALDRIEAAVASPDVECTRWPGRELGRGYYPSMAFKLFIIVDGDEIELADGGPVEWTQRLVGNRKERLTIAGLGLDRLVQIVAAAQPSAAARPRPPERGG